MNNFRRPWLAGVRRSVWLQPAGLALSLLIGLLSAGCVSDPERDRLMREQYPTYSAIIRKSIDAHYPAHGMTRDQVYLALGKPLCRTMAIHEGKKKETWMYPPGGAFPCTSAQYRVYFDDHGLVEGWKHVSTGPEGG
jgi:hypothetical protein